MSIKKINNHAVLFFNCNHYFVKMFTFFDLLFIASFLKCDSYSTSRLHVICIQIRHAISHKSRKNNYFFDCESNTCPFGFLKRSVIDVVLYSVNYCTYDVMLVQDRTGFYCRTEIQIFLTYT